MSIAANSYREHLLKSVSTFLGRWNGCDARLWDYTASHSALTIRITSKSRTGNLHLSCLGPEFIRGPVSWPNCQLHLVPDVALSDGSSGYALVDESVGFEVRGEKVEVAENCKPL